VVSDMLNLTFLLFINLSLRAAYCIIPKLLSLVPR
jgi:hypothetical protein